jgi:hypothetical protein
MIGRVPQEADEEVGRITDSVTGGRGNPPFSFGGQIESDSDTRQMPINKQFL